MVKVVISASLALMLLGVTFDRSRSGPGPDDDFTVHEWGTFTTAAGPAGSAMNWLPLAGPNDLPCFVEHYDNRNLKGILSVGGKASRLLDYQEARSALRASVRMETPVLYFYSKTPVHARVEVSFANGVITEWFPTAMIFQPKINDAIFASTSQPTTSTIVWDSVMIDPRGSTTFPTETGTSHYYAARETDATPVSVKKSAERFLFYRGVGAFPAPITATVGADNKVTIENLHRDPISTFIILASHGGKIGYQIHKGMKREISADIPPLTGDIKKLERDLVQILVDHGLFEKEARAMVATWHDSWLEEGTRVFYLMPQRQVDAILPLKIEPRPKNIVRVFVGRMEIFNAETIKSVTNAFLANDTATVARYGRFLGPISERIIADNPGLKTELTARMNTMLREYLASGNICEVKQGKAIGLEKEPNELDR